MSETKACQHEPLLQLHGRTIIGTKRCKHCGLNEAYWDRASAYAPDPRIIAADAMAKALEVLADEYGVLTTKVPSHFANYAALDDANAALAAYNALK